jgi:hypothetical protein
VEGLSDPTRCIGAVFKGERAKEITEDVKLYIQTEPSEGEK